MPRMDILKKAEQKEFDTPPLYNSAERKQNFTFPKAVIQYADKLRSPTTKIAFLVAYGYFKGRNRFYSPKSYHKRDIQYVANKYNLLAEEFIPSNYLPRTRRYHQQTVLDFFGWLSFDEGSEMVLISEIDSMVSSSLKPKLIFWRCIDFLVSKKIQIPGYQRVASLILLSLTNRRTILSEIARSELTLKNRSLLNELFSQGSKDSSNSSYKLTLLKRISQSSKPTKIKERIKDLEFLEQLYKELTPVFNKLDLDNEAIRYYAGSVIRSEVFQISRRAEEGRTIYLVAFIAHQYYSLQDNLIDVLLAAVKTFQNTSKRQHKEHCYEFRREQAQSVEKLLDIVKGEVFHVLDQIEDIVNDKQLEASKKVNQITSLLSVNSSHIHKTKEQYSALKQKAGDTLSQSHYYDILESRSLRLQNRVGSIIKTIHFQAEAGAKNVMDAIDHYKSSGNLVCKEVPSAFLSRDEYNMVFPKDGTFRKPLYRALLFQRVASSIKSGTLNLIHSYKYQSLDKYMISKDRWSKEKNTLIDRANLKDFENIHNVLSVLDNALIAQYQQTNLNIDCEKNPYLKSTGPKTFTINTPKQVEHETDPLRTYFPEQNFIPLNEILWTVNEHSSFVEELQHWQQHHTRGDAPKKELFAGIMGLGCAIGVRKMARISPDIKEDTLQRVVNWYMSKDNLHAANDAIIRLMNDMELPNIYRKASDKLHTASDGQKFEVRKESLNANYSFKYFGKGQGVSAYTFIDERNLLWHSLVFSASERESAFVIDGLMHNEVVKSDIHSTDTHGYSESIFATTHMLGFSYAPRIKNLKKQTLYVFKSRQNEINRQWTIKPDKYVNIDLIIEYWDDILRLIATIKLKESTASDIFHRLNSYSKQNMLYKALKAFGQIIKTLFILRYLDDVQLRQDIEKQLNKAELSNRFTRAVAVGNPREYVYGNKEDQEIAESCNRLIKNAIVCWNYLYLTQKLNTVDNKTERKNLLSVIAKHSPMSWAHINLLGEYDFSDEKLKDSFNIQSPKKMSLDI